MNIRADDNDEDVLESFTTEERRDISNMARDPNIYDKFVCPSGSPPCTATSTSSVALMLFGGVHKKPGRKSTSEATSTSWWWVTRPAPSRSS